MDEGDIVGCSHNLYLSLKIGDESVVGRRGADLAVHPDFRGRGIYGKMTTLKDEMQNKLGPTLSYWTTVNPVVARNNIKNEHPRFPQPLIRLRSVLDMDIYTQEKVILSGLAKRIRYNTITGLENIRKPRGYETSARDVVFHKISLFDERLDDLWGEMRNMYSFIIKRDTRYLNWRYCDPRGGDYTIIQAEEGGKVLGFCVLTTESSDGDVKRGYIVDMLTTPGRGDVAHKLVDRLMIFFDDVKATYVDSMVLARSKPVNVLRRHGFVKVGENTKVFYAPRGIDQLKNLSGESPSRLHFTFGDTDAI